MIREVTLKSFCRFYMKITLIRHLEFETNSRIILYKLKPEETTVTCTKSTIEQTYP